MIDPENKIGYIRMSSFARNTYRDLEIAMDELKQQGVKGLVFDLRFNPGGLLDSAIKVTDLFVDDGLIVSIRPRGGPPARRKFNGQQRRLAARLPDGLPGQRLQRLGQRDRLGGACRTTTAP